MGDEGWLVTVLTIITAGIALAYEWIRERFRG